MAPTLGYWDIRGLAGTIRSLLHYTGTEFEDKKYAIGPAPDFDREEWLKDKRSSLGLDYPNLPYYIDGNVKLTQSIAILKHLGRKHGLTSGNTEEDLCREDIAMLQIYDVRREFIRVAYSPKFESEKDAYIKDLPEKLAPFSKFLGTNPWLLGDKLTYVDFTLYEMLDFIKFLASDIVNSFSNLKDFMQRFETLPNIQKYQKSGYYRNWPICMPFATFGGSGDPPVV